MKARLMQGWDFARVLRAGLAVAFLGAGVTGADGLALLAGGFFGLQAVFNVGCCGAVCASPSGAGREPRPERIQYEEIERP